MDIHKLFAVSFLSGLNASVDVARLVWQWVVAWTTSNYRRSPLQHPRDYLPTALYPVFFTLTIYMLYIELQILCLEDVRLQSMKAFQLRFRAEADLADDCALFVQLTVIAEAHEILNGTCFRGGQYKKFALRQKTVQCQACRQLTPCNCGWPGPSRLSASTTPRPRRHFMPYLLPCGINPKKWEGHR